MDARLERIEAKYERETRLAPRPKLNVATQESINNFAALTKTILSTDASLDRTHRQHRRRG